MGCNMSTTPEPTPTPRADHIFGSVALIERRVGHGAEKLCYQLETELAASVAEVARLKEQYGVAIADRIQGDKFNAQLRAERDALAAQCAKLREAAQAFIAWICPLFKEKNPQTHPTLVALLETLAATPDDCLKEKS